MPNSPDVTRRYQAARQVGAYFVDPEAGLIEVRGADRAAWLNNLVTNVVKTLQPGEGHYAFATTVQGRAVFDADILALDDRLWLLLDVRRRDAALEHLNRYIITENVSIADATNQWSCAAILGPAARPLAEQLGVANFSTMSRSQHVALPRFGARLMRDDIAALPRARLIAPKQAMSALIDAAQAAGAAELDQATMEILRVEAGVPRSVDDIDGEVVPPETGQIERGISYHKGCYLGQEVIERMRSHGILARKLVGLRLDGQAVPTKPAPLLAEGQPVGRVTSGVFSEAIQSPLALGYVKSAHAEPGTALAVQMPDGPTPCRVIALPILSELRP